MDMLDRQSMTDYAMYRLISVPTTVLVCAFKEFPQDSFGNNEGNAKLLSAAANKNIKTHMQNGTLEVNISDDEGSKEIRMVERGGYLRVNIPRADYQSLQQFIDPDVQADIDARKWVKAYAEREHDTVKQ